MNNRNKDKWPWVREDSGTRNSKLPLYIQLQDEIRDLIENLYWKSGEQIPTEAEISKATNISINTVKKALYGLVLDGYLCRRQGYGTFVASIVERPGSSYRFINMVDESGHDLEPIKTELLSIVKESSTVDIADRLQINPGDDIYLLVRKRSYDNEPIALIFEWIVADFFPNLEKIPSDDYKIFPLPVLMEKHYGFSWRTSDEFISIKKSTEYVQEILGVPEGAPLLFSEIIFKTHKGVVFEYRTTFIRTDKYRFVRGRTAV